MSRRRPSSLAAQLFQRILLLVAMIGATMAALTFWAARTQVYHAADGQLVASSNVLYALMEDELLSGRGRSKAVSIDESLLSGEDLRAFRLSADRRMFAIFHDGRLMLRSDTAPMAQLNARQIGFDTIDTPDGRWRVYGLGVPANALSIQVGERLSVRDTVLINVAKKIFIPLFLLILGSAAMIWISLHDGLLHIRQLSYRLSQRSPRDTEPLAPEDWPNDLTLLITTLNGLFARVDAAFWRERQFTDDAAHQLRTPLAALKLQVQALARTQSDGDRIELTAALLTAVDQASLLVWQMLTLARLDAGELDRETLDVATIMIECVADRAGIAARRDVALAFDGDRQAWADADATALRLIFSNLIENAVKHTPGGSTVLVTLKRDAEAALVVTVADEGPGIAESERPLVLQRFHRSSTGGIGTGLGLAIVASAVRLLGGELSLENVPAGSGLLARVTIPSRASVSHQLRRVGPVHPTGWTLHAN